MDNNRPRPLYCVGEQAISLVSNQTVEILDLEWLEENTLCGNPHGSTSRAAASGYYYESTRNPGFRDHESMYRKRPDLGTWEDCAFNPHKVKQPEAA